VEQATGQMLVFAVGMALSPLPIIAVVLLLTSAQGKASGVAFVLGSVISTALLGAVLLVTGVGSTSGDGAPSTRTSLLRLALGVSALALAARKWRGRPEPGVDAPMPKWMGVVDRFSPPRAFVGGIVLNVLNPKNLLFIVGGAAAVAAAGASGAEEARAWVVFTLIAAIGVATPVVISFAMGDHAEPLLARLKVWMARNSGVIMAMILLLIGVKLVGDAVTAL
jgi:threonine/homoserine/homoserine lactone efflux protein